MIYSDLLIAWQTHCTLQVSTVRPHSSGPVSGGLINCELPTVRQWLPQCVFLLILLTSLHMTRFPRPCASVFAYLNYTGGDKRFWTNAKLCIPCVNYAQRFSFNTYLLHLCVLTTYMLTLFHLTLNMLYSQTMFQPKIFLSVFTIVVNSQREALWRSI